MIWFFIALALASIESHSWAMHWNCAIHFETFIFLAFFKADWYVLFFRALFLKISLNANEDESR